MSEATTSYADVSKKSSHIEMLGEFSIVIFDNPKSQLEGLDRVFLDRLLGEIHIATADGFNVPLEQKSVKGIEDHVLSVDLLALAYKGDILYGFASAKIIGETFFLHGIALCTVGQGSGIGSMILVSMLKRKHYPLIAFTTQNPAMYLLARKFTLELYPSPIHEDVPSEYKELAHQYVAKRRGTFIPQEMVIQDLYTECLYPCITHVTDKVVDEWFRKKLRIDSSGLTRDGFIFIGTVTS